MTKLTFLIIFSDLQEPLKITVYYESSMKESGEFINTQLMNVWDELYQEIQLQMVPIAIIQVGASLIIPMCYIE